MLVRRHILIQPLNVFVLRNAYIKGPFLELKWTSREQAWSRNDRKHASMRTIKCVLTPPEDHGYGMNNRRLLSRYLQQ